MFLAKPENDREWSEINLDGKSKIEIGEERIILDQRSIVGQNTRQDCLRDQISTRLSSRL